MTLAARLARHSIVVAPGVWDALSALLAEQAGFEAVFLSGSALAFTQLGRPDVGLLSVHELAAACSRIADRVDIPVLVDADSGYGGTANLQRTVRLLERAGAAAIQIEDQIVVKAADALNQRPVVSSQAMVGRIKAAQDARTTSMLISARTDSLPILGIDATIARCEAYLTARCDLLFVEGITDRADIARLTAAFGATVPLVHNLLEGRTPFTAASEAEAAGFRLALMPVSLLGIATAALVEALPIVRAEGSTAAVRDRMVDARTLTKMVGSPEFLAAAARWAGS